MLPLVMANEQGSQFNLEGPGRRLLRSGTEIETAHGFGYWPS